MTSEMKTVRELSIETGYSDCFIRKILKKAGVEKNERGKTKVIPEVFYDALRKHKRERVEKKRNKNSITDLFGFILENKILDKYNTVSDFCRDNNIDNISKFTTALKGEHRATLTDAEIVAIKRLFGV